MGDAQSIVSAHTKPDGRVDLGNFFDKHGEIERREACTAEFFRDRRAEESELTELRRRLEWEFLRLVILHHERTKLFLGKIARELLHHKHALRRPDIEPGFFHKLLLTCLVRYRRRR